MNNEYKVITKEEHIKILKKLAIAIDKKERNFTDEEWEYIHDSLITAAMRLQFGE